LDRAIKLDEVVEENVQRLLQELWNHFPKVEMRKTEQEWLGVVPDIEASSGLAESKQH